MNPNEGIFVLFTSRNSNISSKVAKKMVCISIHVYERGTKAIAKIQRNCISAEHPRWLRESKVPNR